MNIETAFTSQTIPSSNTLWAAVIRAFPPAVYRSWRFISSHSHLEKHESIIWTANYFAKKWRLSCIIPCQVLHLAVGRSSDNLILLNFSPKGNYRFCSQKQCKCFWCRIALKCECPPDRGLSPLLRPIRVRCEAKLKTLYCCDSTLALLETLWATNPTS